MGKKSKKMRVCGFIKKLIELLQDEENEHIVGWGQSLNQFVIRNVAEFTHSIAPQKFKHHNYSSFVRQLNIYGFTKSKNAQNTYEHIYLQKNNPQQLCKIQRKMKNNLIENPQSQQIVEEPMNISIRFNDLKNNFQQLKSQNKKLKEDQKKLKVQSKDVSEIMNDLLKGIISQALIEYKMRESVIQTDEYRSQGSDKREQTGDPEQVNTILNYLIQNQIYNYDNIKLAVEVFKSKSQKFSYEEINDSYLNIDQDKQIQENQEENIFEDSSIISDIDRFFN